MTRIAKMSALALAVVWLTGTATCLAASDSEGAVCANPKQVQGFKTCADLDKAVKEGGVVIYSPDVEQGTAKMLQAFQQLFPQIKTNYVRLQTGALYAKI